MFSILVVKLVTLDDTEYDADVEPVIDPKAFISDWYVCIWDTFSTKFSILFLAEEKLTNSSNVSYE